MFRAGTHCPTEAYFMDTLGDIGKHDVHNAYAADKEGDSADDAEDQIKDALDFPGLGQHFQGNDELKVVYSVMGHMQASAEEGSAGLDLIRLFNLNKELGQRLGFVVSFQGTQRKENAVIEVVHGDLALFRIQCILAGKNANDQEQLLTNADFLVELSFLPQADGYLPAQHANLLATERIGLADKAPLGHANIKNLRITGCAFHELRVQTLGKIYEVMGSFSDPCGVPDKRVILFQSFSVTVLKTGRVALLGMLLLFLAELICPDVDIIDAQLFNMTHGLLFCPFTDGYDRHYRHDAADYPQDGEQGAEFLLEQRQSSSLEQQPESVALFAGSGGVIGDGHCADIWWSGLVGQLQDHGSPE